MTPKQKRFVNEYLIDLNATAAATRAGYSEKTAHSQGPRLLKNVGIQAAIQERLPKSEDVDLTVQKVIKGLYAEATYTGDGASHGARVAAWQHLGKYLGMFIDRKIIGIKRLEDMEDDELRNLVGQIAGEIGVVEGDPLQSAKPAGRA